jgi:hypothetical protein
LIRILGVIVGIAFLLKPFMKSASQTDTDSVPLGLAFLAYGLGGDRLLAKVAPPSWSEKLRLRRHEKTEEGSQSSKPPAA